MIKITKNIKFALHPARGPVVILKKDQVRDFGKAGNEAIVKAKCGEFVITRKVDPKPAVKARVSKSEIVDIVNSGKKKKAIKEDLEEWGKANLGIDIDKRNGIKSLVETLEEAMNGN